MPARHLEVRPEVPAGLVDALAELRAELDVPADFDAAVHRAAASAAERPRLPTPPSEPPEPQPPQPSADPRR